MSFKLLLTWGGTDLVWIWRQGDAKAETHVRLYPSRHGKGEVLHEGGEKEEQLHPGQVLSQTQSFTWVETMQRIN